MQDVMFTGIIQDIGVVQTCESQSDGLKAVISTQLSVAQVGASVACSGACLTVIAHEKNAFTVEISPETLARTNLKHWKPGAKINLEPALKLGDALDGHLVTGHVDGLATLHSITQTGNSWNIAVAVPEGLQKFIAEKGSATLDGVSLTVNRVADPLMELMIIPHTWAHTCFQYYQVGDRLNLEIDIMARYAARLTGKP